MVQVHDQVAKGPRQRALIVYKVIGRQKHDVSERIAVQDRKYAEQHAIGGTAVLRLNDYVSDGQGLQGLAPVTGMLLRDDGAHLLRRRDVAGALQCVVNECAAPSQRAELLGHRVTGGVPGERGEPGALTGGQNHGPGSAGAAHRASSRLCARPPRCQDRPRAARVCHVCGSTACLERIEGGSQLRGVWVTTENSQASGAKLNVKSVLVFIPLLSFRSNMPGGDGHVGAERDAHFAGGGTSICTTRPPTMRSQVPLGT